MNGVKRAVIADNGMRMTRVGRISADDRVNGATLHTSRNANDTNGADSPIRVICMLLSIFVI
jgi:hypothetical protein